MSVSRFVTVLGMAVLISPAIGQEEKSVHDMAPSQPPASRSEAEARKVPDINALAYRSSVFTEKSGYKPGYESIILDCEWRNITQDRAVELANEQYRAGLRPSYDDYRRAKQPHSEGGFALGQAGYYMIGSLFGIGEACPKLAKTILNLRRSRNIPLKDLCSPHKLIELIPCNSDISLAVERMGSTELERKVFSCHEWFPGKGDRYRSYRCEGEVKSHYIGVQ